MKTTNPNLPLTTLPENHTVSGMQNTLRLILGVLKLAKKVFLF
ncbi:hypothetical protein OAB88_00895 [Winogradskyella sp.]|nr:hypothetical protein [Winogradskyella sp.]MDC1503606.1 hypothetical protein [Winogradskyella sp.]